MQHANLGNSGLQVSRFCVGTDTFGARTDAADALRILARALEAGINFIDTADLYGGGGASEEIVGRFIASRRQEAVVCTKGYHRTGPGPNAIGNSRKHIMHAAEQSLRRLGTDYVDLYLLHYYDYNCPLEESVRALEDLIRQGKARYVGCSNFAGHQLTHAQWIADALGGTGMVAAQTRYNLLNREPEAELIPACRELGVAITAYSVQAGGMLLGKHRLPDSSTRFSENSPSRSFYRNAYWNDWCFNAIDSIAQTAEQHSVSMAALALQWLRDRAGAEACIVGIRTMQQLEDGIAAWQEQVPAEAMDQAHAISDELLRNSPWRGVASQPEANAPNQQAAQEEAQQP